MFSSKEVPRYQRHLENELERVISHMKSTGLMDSQEYDKLLKTAERLHNMMDKEQPSSVSQDAVLTVVANLLGIFMIIRHESVNVISSKALSFVFRTRA